MTRPEVEDFMHQLDVAITKQIDIAAVAHHYDDELLPAILTVLSRITSSIAIEYGLPEKQFLTGMAGTYRLVQQTNAARTAAEAISKAAGPSA